ncbi:MAG TPA: hypothetical protein VIM56_02135 [Rhizomicrobium sp.]
MFWRKRRSDDEFTEISSSEVKSNKGFRVIAGHGSTRYYEGLKKVEVNSEYMGTKDGIYIYKTSPSNKGLSRLSSERIAEIFENIERGLNFLGLEVVFVD